MNPGYSSAEMLREGLCKIRVASDNPPEPDWMPDDATISEHFGRSLINSRYKVILAKRIGALLPRDGPLSVLDVGAGDGLLGAFFMRYRPETEVRGIETFVRVGDSPIRLDAYNGREIPFASASLDVVLFSNVLHHTANQRQLMSEALRVGRRQILIKDHVYKSLLGRAKLVVLDLLGNFRFGVATTADYLRHEEWERLFVEAGIPFVCEYPAIPLRAGLLRAAFENDLEVIFDIPLVAR
jgi:SAM-dependent methyltransferase